MTTESYKADWRDRVHPTLLPRRESHWQEITLVQYGFFAYTLLVTVLYLNVPLVGRGVAWLDWGAVVLEDMIPIFVRYRVVLAERGEGEWILLARHVTMASLIAVALEVFFYLLRLREHLEAFVTLTLAKPRTIWWNGSFSRFLLWVLLAFAVTAFCIWMLYVWGGPLEGTTLGERIFTNNYLRSLLLVPSMALGVGLLISTCLVMVLAVFSQRLRAGLR